MKSFVNQYLTPCHLLRAPAAPVNALAFRGLFSTPVSASAPAAKEADWTSEPGSFSTEKISSIPTDFPLSDENKPTGLSHVDISSLLSSAKKAKGKEAAVVKAERVINDDLPDFLTSPPKISSSSILDMIQPSPHTPAPVTLTKEKNSRPLDPNTESLTSESKKTEKKIQTEAPVTSKQLSGPAKIVVLKSEELDLTSSAVESSVKKGSSKISSKSLSSSEDPELTRLIRESVREAVREAVKVAIRTAFQDAVIPAMESGISSMFIQVNKTLETSLKAFEGAVGQEASQAKGQQSQLFQNSVNQLQASMSSVESQLKSLNQTMTDTMNRLKDVEGAIMSLDTGTRSPEVDLDGLIAEGKFSEALNTVVMRNNFDLLLEILSKLSQSQLLGQCSAPVQLCVVHRLAEDLSIHDPKEVSHLSFAILLSDDDIQSFRGG